MSNGVFIHRADSIYDDSPAERYQFPKSYLSRAQQCVGDWIVYYEPTKVQESRGYYAVARVFDVVPDPTLPDMYVTLIEPGSYLEFPNSVPFSVGGNVVETGVLNDRGRISGRAQAALRFLSPNDFQRILDLGLAEPGTYLPRTDVSESEETGFGEGGQAPFEIQSERPLVLVSRKMRDRAFRRVVLRAYEERCAVTGLRLINGGGRAEVEAAHIKPVGSNGPDIVNNGVPLSGTVHWMFDRGLISIADDLSILISRHVNDRGSVETLINSTGRLIGPTLQRDRPHPAFLSWHRENCFKT